MTTRTIFAGALALAVFGSVGLVSGYAAAEARAPAFSLDPAAVKSRLDNVQRLVMTSSGARRILDGNDAAAKETRDNAENYLRDAEDAYGKGDMQGAQEALQRATEEMFSAIRKVGTGKDGVEKRSRDFDNKADSVDVLLNAIDRVATEKGGMSRVQASAAAIRQRAEAAKALAGKGEVKAARSQLDAVYEDAKLELEKLREGETLVRTLAFASDEEEYHYELDRNDTHKMLLKVLISERETKPNAQKLIDSYVGQSTQLRSQAEAEAGRGKYDLAVKSLEEATKYLQRAIRSAGVYIPG